MNPVELDISVGIHGERCAWRFEGFADLDPLEFVTAMQQFAMALLRPSSTSASAGDAPPGAAGVPCGAAGEVVSGEGAGSSVTSGPAPEPRDTGRWESEPRRRRFDPEATRARAAEAS